MLSLNLMGWRKGVCLLAMREQRCSEAPSFLTGQTFKFTWVAFRSPTGSLTGRLTDSLTVSPGYKVKLRIYRSLRLFCCCKELSFYIQSFQMILVSVHQYLLVYSQDFLALKAKARILNCNYEYSITFCKHLWALHKVITLNINHINRNMIFKTHSSCLYSQ